jgi:hypothetical protein
MLPADDEDSADTKPTPAAAASAAAAAPASASAASVASAASDSTTATANASAGAAASASIEHLDFIRLIFAYLRTHGRREGVKRVFARAQALPHATNGAVKFHFTRTYFWYE